AVEGLSAPACAIPARAFTPVTAAPNVAVHHFAQNKSVLLTDHLRRVQIIFILLVKLLGERIAVLRLACVATDSFGVRFNDSIAIGVVNTADVKRLDVIAAVGKYRETLRHFHRRQTASTKSNGLRAG